MEASGTDHLADDEEGPGYDKPYIDDVPNGYHPISRLYALLQQVDVNVKEECASAQSQKKDTDGRTDVPHRRRLLVLLSRP